MITVGKGNLLTSEAEALVNTVNCEGFMGKGIALQFKKAFPDNFLAYQKECRIGNIQPGKVFVFRTNSMINPKYIVNFPTKNCWRGNAKIEYIRDGMISLAKAIENYHISSIAMPPLGCGLGGLQWSDVKPIIVNTLSRFPSLNLILFEPVGTPAASAMPIHTKRPQMTLSRALFIQLMAQYIQISYRITMLEIQKLAYFLQEAGEPLKLRYVAHIYGPYAHNLNKVLESMEGHFIAGYGDSQKHDIEINLLPGAFKEVQPFLNNRTESHARLNRVADLIDGFATPYGMELLATVHWVAKHDQVTTDEETISAVQNWSERKCKLFKPEHIIIARKHLTTTGWL